MMYIRGFERVRDNLNKEILKIKGRSMAGLINAAIIVRRSMEATSPLTPVDLGNLRASWFVATYKGNVADDANPTFVGPRADKLKEGHLADVSENVERAKSKSMPFLVMGFSANYAMYVHERTDSPTWSRPGSGAFFFEAALYRNKGAILQSIKDEVQL